jgi:hypothetical protein
MDALYNFQEKDISNIRKIRIHKWLNYNENDAFQEKDISNIRKIWTHKWLNYNENDAEVINILCFIQN